MDYASLVTQIKTIFGYIPGGLPAFAVTLFMFGFAVVATYKLFRSFVPKTPSSPKDPPPANPPLPKAPPPPGLENEAGSTQPGVAAAALHLDQQKAADAAAGKPPGARPAKPETAPGSRAWPFSGQAKAKIRRISMAHLKQSFRQQLDQLEDYLSDREARYRIPWFLMLGETGAGKSTSLANLGLPQPFGPPAAYADSTQPKGCDWWFYNEGIVLDVSGDCVLYRDAATDSYVADEKGWQALLKLLRKYRPRRPIDGVILTIPSTDLTDTTLLPEVLRHKADQLYQKLWQMQKSLGMRLPVYVLLTKSDHIAGFKSFCQILPARLTKDIFGWSNPYSLETAYNNTMVEQAFQKMYRDLNETQLELVTINKTIPDNDSFLLFPHELRAVFKQLRLYLEQVFKPSTYHEPFFFRGIYFCGDEGQRQAVLAEGDAALVAAAHALSDSLRFTPDTERATRPEPHPVFLQQLFQDKLFQEAGLARPVRDTYKTQHTLLHVVQGSLAVAVGAGLAGQWYAFQSLNAEKATLVPVFEQSLRDTQRLNELNTNVRFDPSYFAELSRARQTSAINLLTNMAAIQSDGLQSWLLPSSWFSQIDEKIIAALSAAYDRFVLDWLYQGLHIKARHLLHDSLDTVDNYITPSQEKGEALSDLSEFKNIQNFIAHIEALQKNVETYNHLKKTDSQTKDVAELVDYLYHIALLPGFYTHTGFYSRAITNADYMPFDLSLYQQPARTRLGTLRSALFARLFTHNLLDKKVSTLAAALEALAQTSRHTEWYSILKQLNGIIQDIEAYLAKPAFAWVVNAELDLGGDYDKLWQRVRGIDILGDEIYQQAHSDAQAAFASLREQLQAYKSALTDVLMLPRQALKTKDTSAATGGGSGGGGGGATATKEEAAPEEAPAEEAPTEEEATTEEAPAEEETATEEAAPEEAPAEEEAATEEAAPEEAPAEEEAAPETEASAAVTEILVDPSKQDLRLVLSPAVVQVRQLLTDFLARDFMGNPGTPQPLITELPDNKRLLWDTAKLQAAVKLVESFQQFIDNELAKFPPALQDIAKNAGHYQLHENLTLMLAQAQTLSMPPRQIGPDFERSLRTEIENFAAAAPTLTWLLHVLNTLKDAEVFQDKFANTYNDLEQITVLQAHRLLSRVNRLLNEDDLYLPTQADVFKDWKSNRQVPLVAFHANDRQELAYYLGVQRDRVHYLVQTYAQPLLGFLAEKKVPVALGSSEVIPRWTRISTEVFKYDSEKPQNTLTELETFVLHGLDGISPANCYSRLYSPDLGQPRGDYFQKKQADIQLALFNQCRGEQQYLGETSQSENKRSLQTSLSLGEGLYWDADILREAVANAETFGKFVDEELPKLPAAQQNIAKDSGFAQFHLDIIDKLASAQNIIPHSWLDGGGVSFDEGLQGEIQNFAEAAPMLTWFIEYFGTFAKASTPHQQKFAGSRDILLQLGLLQARRLLDQTDVLLGEDKLYRPQPVNFFADWANKTPLSLLVFGVESREQLDAYLRAQRERLRNLAQNYAQPMLTFMAGKEAAMQDYSDAVPRWTTLYGEIFKYDNAKPENSLTALETFITTELDKVNPANCYNNLYGELAAGDYFQTRQRELQAALLSQCKQQQYYVNPADPRGLASGQPPRALQTQLPLNTGLFWELAQLQNAVLSAEAFGKLIDERLPTLAPATQETVSNQGYAEFYSHLTDMLARAQRLEARQWTQDNQRNFEEGLSQEVANFNETKPLLDWLSSFIERLATLDTPSAQLFAQQHAALTGVRVMQAHRLLSYTGDLLSQNDLYTPKDKDFFMRWDGSMPLSALAFGSLDKEELGFYLSTQRDRVHHLAQQYAQPLLTFLADKPLPPQLGSSNAVPLWTRLYTELFKYDSENPDNSLAYLETFIRDEMNKITLGNCYVELADKAASSGDYFLDKRARLQANLFEQCQFLADLEAYRRYHLIADFFNQKLSNRLPFSTVSYKNTQREAEPEDIQDFFEIYNAYGEGLQDFISNSANFGESRKAALQFLDKLTHVKHFFGALLSQKLPLETPLFDLVIDFRVNQNHEVGANQIIAWDLDKTTRAVTRFDQGQRSATKPNVLPEREGSWHFSDRWQFGEALRFSFRWARNSAYRPFWDGITPGLTISGDDDTAVFEFRSRWALLEMIRKQQASVEDFDRMEDSEPHTLKFEIPVRRLLGAKRIPQQQRPPEPPPPLPETQIEGECYMDWFEQSYGDPRCLDQNYKRLETRKLPSQTAREFENRQQDTPYPSTVTEDGTLTGETLDKFNAAHQEAFLEASKTRLFVRFSVSLPDRKDRLLVPDFPIRAPLLSGFSERYRRYEARLRSQQQLLPPQASPAEVLAGKTAAAQAAAKPATPPAAAPTEAAPAAAATE